MQQNPILYSTLRGGRRGCCGAEDEGVAVSFALEFLLWRPGLMWFVCDFFWFLFSG